MLESLQKAFNGFDEKIAPNLIKCRDAVREELERLGVDLKSINKNFFHPLRWWFEIIKIVPDFQDVLREFTAKHGLYSSIAWLNSVMPVLLALVAGQSDCNDSWFKLAGDLTWNTLTSYKDYNNLFGKPGFEELFPQQLLLGKRKDGQMFPNSKLVFVDPQLTENKEAPYSLVGCPEGSTKNKDDFLSLNEGAFPDDYVVKEILAHKINDQGGLCYLVSWLGWPSKANTWENWADNLQNTCSDLTRAYHGSTALNRQKLPIKIPIEEDSDSDDEDSVEKDGAQAETRENQHPEKRRKLDAGDSKSKA